MIILIMLSTAICLLQLEERDPKGSHVHRHHFVVMDVSQVVRVEM